MFRVLPGVKVKMECDGDGWQATTTSTAATLKVDGILDTWVSFSLPLRLQALVMIAETEVLPDKQSLVVIARYVSENHLTLNLVPRTSRNVFVSKLQYFLSFKYKYIFNYISYVYI